MKYSAEDFELLQEEEEIEFFEEFEIECESFKRKKNRRVPKVRTKV
jgi:hypothetical protein